MRQDPTFSRDLYDRLTQEQDAHRSGDWFRGSPRSATLLDGASQPPGRVDDPGRAAILLSGDYSRLLAGDVTLRSARKPPGTSGGPRDSGRPKPGASSSSRLIGRTDENLRRPSKLNPHIPPETSLIVRQPLTRFGSGELPPQGVQSGTTFDSLWELHLGAILPPCVVGHTTVKRKVAGSNFVCDCFPVCTLLTGWCGLRGYLGRNSRKVTQMGKNKDKK
jgi:hypothetical protein